MGLFNFRHTRKIWCKTKTNPKNPIWVNRDRFVLSAGHGSMLLYSLLYLTGYKSITLNDLKSSLVGISFPCIIKPCTSIHGNKSDIQCIKNSDSLYKKINFPNYNPEFDSSLHKSYSTYYDPKFPNKKPLSLILSGNYFLIK